MRRLKLLVVMTAALLLTSCATILTGSQSTVKFNSEPDNVTVAVEGQSCSTPCALSLKKGSEYLVRFTKNGHRTQTIVLSKGFNVVALLNMFGLIGWVVDFATGALWNVQPETVFVTLPRASASALPTYDAVALFDITGMSKSEVDYIAEHGQMR